jgi:hypothetical protein
MANDKREHKSFRLRLGGEIGGNFIAFNLIVFCKVDSVVLMWKKKIEEVNDRKICALITEETLQVCQ